MKEVKGIWLCPQDGTQMKEVPLRNYRMVYCENCDNHLPEISYKPAVCPICMNNILTFSRAEYLCLNFNCPSHDIISNIYNDNGDVDFYHIQITTIQKIASPLLEVERVTGATIVRNKINKTAQVNMLETNRTFYYLWMIKYLIYDCEINNKPHIDLLDLYSNTISFSKANGDIGKRLDSWLDKINVR